MYFGNNTPGTFIEGVRKWVAFELKPIIKKKGYEVPDQVTIIASNGVDTPIVNTTITFKV